MKKLIFLAMVLGLLVNATIINAQNFHDEWVKIYDSLAGIGDSRYQKAIDKVIDKYIPQLHLRMTDNQVRGLLGKPLRVNQSVGRWGIHEQWIIEMPPPYKTLYLYFESGILTSWQW
jgi:hypothetical protein